MTNLHPVIDRASLLERFDARLARLLRRPHRRGRAVRQANTTGSGRAPGTRATAASASGRASCSAPSTRSAEPTRMQRSTSRRRFRAAPHRVPPARRRDRRRHRASRAAEPVGQLLGGCAPPRRRRTPAPRAGASPRPSSPATCCCTRLRPSWPGSTRRRGRADSAARRARPQHLRHARPASWPTSRSLSAGRGSAAGRAGDDRAQDVRVLVRRAALGRRHPRRSRRRRARRTRRIRTAARHRLPARRRPARRVRGRGRHRQERPQRPATGQGDLADRVRARDAAWRRIRAVVRSAATSRPQRGRRVAALLEECGARRFVELLLTEHADARPRCAADAPRFPPPCARSSPTSPGAASGGSHDTRSGPAHGDGCVARPTSRSTRVPRTRARPRSSTPTRPPSAWRPACWRRASALGFEDVYALVRIADEIVDGAAAEAGLATGEQRELLDALEAGDRARSAHGLQHQPRRARLRRDSARASGIGVGADRAPSSHRCAGISVPSTSPPTS